MAKPQIIRNLIETMHKKRADQVIEAVAQEPDRVVEGSEGWRPTYYLYLKDGSFPPVKVPRDIFKKEHPEAFKTWETHQALKRLRNS